jgi:hypothetical protein
MIQMMLHYMKVYGSKYQDLNGRKMYIFKVLQLLIIDKLLLK